MFDTPMQVATFLAFSFVITFLIFITWLKVPQKMAGWLDQRAMLISKELEEARRLRDEAQVLLQDYLQRTKNAEKEAQAIITQATEDATRLKDEAEKALADMVERRTKSAENKIAQAEAQAIADVRAAATNVAISAAQEVLTTRMKEGLGGQLIDTSIADIKTHLN
ncbi:MAG: ATP F0F1 synthase subunit B [Pseudomonadota bacterium]